MEVPATKVKVSLEFVAETAKLEPLDTLREWVMEFLGDALRNQLSVDFEEFTLETEEAGSLLGP